MEKHSKTAHALTLPYPPPQWPLLSHEFEAAILTLLLPLLEPVGDFRDSHVLRSRGKSRAGKPSRPPDKERTSPQPSIPEIYNHLTIGFNTTVRRLEALSQLRRPSGLSEPPLSHPTQIAPANLLAILVCRRSFPAVLTSSLPSMVVTAAAPPDRGRLIDISPQSEAKIAHALRQPRLGVLGIEMDAPGVDSLAQFVLEHIDKVDIPWLEQPSIPAYLPVKIDSKAVLPKTKSLRGAEKRKTPPDP